MVLCISLMMIWLFTGSRPLFGCFAKESKTKHSFFHSKHYSWQLWSNHSGKSYITIIAMLDFETSWRNDQSILLSSQMH